MPPVTVASIIPSLKPLQVTCVGVNDIANWAGAVMVVVSVTVQL